MPYLPKMSEALARRRRRPEGPARAIQERRLRAASHGSLSPSASARHVTRARTTDRDDGEVEKVLRGTSSLLYLIVSDIEAAHEDPVARSVEISELFHASKPRAQFHPEAAAGSVGGNFPLLR